MKALIILSFLTMAMASFSSQAANTKINLRCTLDSLEECEDKVIKTLEKLQCKTQPETLSCDYRTEIDEDGNPSGEMAYCEVNTDNCTEADPYLLGGTYCRKGEKVKMSRWSKLSLSYSMGLFGSWERTLCKF
jgi:hypothetical protein